MTRRCTLAISLLAAACLLACAPGRPDAAPTAAPPETGAAAEAGAPAAAAAGVPPAPAAPCTIVVAADAAYAETLAAKEVRRYVYLTTGALLPLAAADALPPTGDLIVVSAEDRLSWRTLEAALPPEVRRLKVRPQQYVLHTVTQGGRKALLALGGDDAGVLYAAYRLAEHLGVRFYLDGDVAPDHRAAFRLPDLHETAAPLFDVRGIQPFHDFPEGPDWWNLDDYKAVISQLAKLRMNFIGLHTYPEGHPNAEPAVWIGLPQDVGPAPRVKFAYPASWQNTLRGNWGYKAKKTGEFSFGAADLFDRDDFGADVMAGLCPQPQTPEACIEVFGRAGAMLAEAFRHARRLGVRTCIGTETPLTVPRAVQERLKALGKDPKDPAILRELYEGVFRRIAGTHPLDYYWFWTPEGWTWGGAKPEQVQATLDDLAAAAAAAKKVQAPFTLAACGWVLGPQTDRALFDRTLSKDMPMSCINRQVGKAPVEPAFERIEGRPKWAIPWMEDDPNLLAPQLWAGRMRKDAADALRYGCTGLVGIHWRTRIIGPNVAALAAAAWNQAGWSKPEAAAPQPPRQEGPDGGRFAAFAGARIADTGDPTLYQTVRYDVAAYRLRLPDGRYAVTLKFCEPHYKEAGKRVFGVRIQGRPVVEHLDVFAKAGANRALDCTFKDVEVKGGWVEIEFVPETEFPCIAAIAVEGPGGVRKINCGGPAYKDYAADWPAADGPAAPRGRFLPTGDFYRDWALHHFGPDAGPAAAAIFERIDGRLPEPSTWVGGPGGLKPNERPFEEVQKAYAFIDELAALRPRVRGAGNLERFDYWLANFRCMVAAEKLRCAWGRKDTEGVKAALAEVYTDLLQTVTTPGELGTVANWEQHVLPALPVQPAEKSYHGPMRLIVPTVRTAIEAGEALALRVLVLAEKPPRDLAACVRPLGRGQFARLPLAHVARGVYSAKVTPPAGEDFEYYIEAAPGSGPPVRWPAAAPAASQTVVVAPAAK
ncbi:MAG: hypothetical protein FJ288_07385 [Planctomycetes bacterium]|nr:hypothetical protein [Planctomycetota bacterium]